MGQVLKTLASGNSFCPSSFSLHYHFVFFFSLSRKVYEAHFDLFDHDKSLKFHLKKYCRKLIDLLHNIAVFVFHCLILKTDRA